MKALLLLACVAAASALPNTNPLGGRIFGGKEAADGAYPFMVSLEYENSAEYLGHGCGGSLLTTTVVLTAAHCHTTLVDPGIYRAVAGMTNRLDRRFAQTRLVIQRICHPGYKEGTDPADIALFIVQSPFEINSRVALVTIPSVRAEEPAGPGVIIGWGLDESLERSIPLKELQTRILSTEECGQRIEEMIGPSNFNASNICTGGLPEGGHSACSTDSGGPVIRNVNGVWVQLGIVSWGTGCGSPNGPTVNCRVSHYLDWIDSYLKP